MSLKPWLQSPQASVRPMPAALSEGNEPCARLRASSPAGTVLSEVGRATAHALDGASWVTHRG